MDKYEQIVLEHREAVMELLKDGTEWDLRGLMVAIDSRLSLPQLGNTLNKLVRRGENGLRKRRIPNDWVYFINLKERRDHE
jgi:hypothetical protein